MNHCQWMNLKKVLKTNNNERKVTKANKNKPWDNKNKPDLRLIDRLLIEHCHRHYKCLKRTDWVEIDCKSVLVYFSHLKQNLKWNTIKLNKNNKRTFEENVKNGWKDSSKTKIVFLPATKESHRHWRWSNRCSTRHVCACVAYRSRCRLPHFSGRRRECASACQTTSQTVIDSCCYLSQKTKKNCPVLSPKLKLKLRCDCCCCCCFHCCCYCYCWLRLCQWACAVLWIAALGTASFGLCV